MYCILHSQLWVSDYSEGGIMNIEKWIDENKMDIGEPESGFHSYAVDVDDLLELLKDNAIVPREIPRRVAAVGAAELSHAWVGMNSEIRSAYSEMVKYAEGSES